MFLTKYLSRIFRKPKESPTLEKELAFNKSLEELAKAQGRGGYSSWRRKRAYHHNREYEPDD
jgi:hypothetical protein